MAFIPYLAAGVGSAILGSMLESKPSNNDALRQEFKNQIDSMKASHANDLRSRDEIIAQKSAEIKELRMRLDKALEEMVSLKQDNSNLRAEIANLKSQIGELQAIVVELL